MDSLSSKVQGPLVLPLKIDTGIQKYIYTKPAVGIGYWSNITGGVPLWSAYLTNGLCEEITARVNKEMITYSVRKISNWCD
jgi:hypothetical protein